MTLFHKGNLVTEEMTLVRRQLPRILRRRGVLSVSLLPDNEEPRMDSVVTVSQEQSGLVVSRRSWGEEIARHPGINSCDIRWKNGGQARK